MTNHLRSQPNRTVDVRIPAIEKYAYCLRLHVKPTTIFIAIFKLIRALLFASILLNTEFTFNERVNDLTIGTVDRHRSTAIAVHILTKIIVASVSAVGIYAVISGRAALLMPLYAILLLDFFFAVPSFYNRDLDPSIADSLAEFRNNGQGGPTPTYARYSSIPFSTLTMLIKVYFLCVVWKCYRYLRLIELVSPLRLSEIYPHISQGVVGPQYPIIRVLGSGDSSDIVNAHNNLPPPPYESIASGMKPPNYEEAIKSPNMSFSNTNPHQQTVVISNINHGDNQQSISTQVVNDFHIRSALENIVTDIEARLEGDSSSDASIETITNVSSLPRKISQGDNNKSGVIIVNNALSPHSSTSTTVVINDFDDNNSKTLNH